jgi:hypothetical protein
MNRRQEEDMTMDEILASIRRYVSGDGQDGSAPEEHLRETQFSSPPSYAYQEEDTYKNTPKAPDVVRLTSEFEVPRDRPAQPTFAERSSYEVSSQEKNYHAKNPFEKLSEAVKKNASVEQEPPHGALNLDQIFRKMAKDMIQQWVDKNMPSIVETLVEKEIQRLTGRSS